MKNKTPTQRSGLQRIGPENYERFLSARITRPDLTFDRWISELWRIAIAAKPPGMIHCPEVDADELKDESLASAPATESRRRGRPIGSRMSFGLTGRDMRRHLFGILLAAPQHRLPKSTVIARIEKSLGSLEEHDVARTSAGIARWKHALLSDVAQLRKRGVLAAESDDPVAWVLTSAVGVREARQFLAKVEPPRSRR